MTTERLIRLGTRGSALARWQTEYVRSLLQAAWPDVRTEVTVITTAGDQILDKSLPQLGGKGLFTAELESALLAGEIDFAVHSLKDLPTEVRPGLAIGAVPPRARVHDVLVSRAGHTVDTLPDGATVGTSSQRRAGQLKHRNRSWQIRDIRGNVDTRIRKALDLDGGYEAIVLAYAGLERLKRLDVISQTLSLDVMLPAPGQGALGIQCRDEAESLHLLAAINHRDTKLAVTAERTFLSAMGGGCAVPIAAYARVEDRQFHLRGRINTLDGTHQIDLAQSLPFDSDQEHTEIAKRLALQLAAAMRERGALEILEAIP